MCWNRVYDQYPFLAMVLSHQWQIWSLLGMMNASAVFLCYFCLTRPMPRWCAIVSWSALPASIGLTFLYFLSLVMGRVMGLP